MSLTTFPSPVRTSVQVYPTCLTSNGCLVRQYGCGFLSPSHVSLTVKPSVFSANAISLQRYSGIRRIHGKERHNCLKKNSLFWTQDPSFRQIRVSAVLGSGQEASSSSSSSSAELSLSRSDSEQKNEGLLEPSPKTTPKPIQKRPFRLPKLLRLRPRLWLLSRKLRHSSIKKVFKRLAEVFWAHKWMSLLSLSLIVSFIFSALSTRWPSPPPALLVPYSEFVHQVVKKMVGEVSFQEGSSLLYYNVKKATIDEASKISGGLMQDLTSGNVLGTGMDSISSLKLEPPWQFVTRRVKRDETFLLTLLLEAGVKFSSVPVPWSSSAKSLVATMLMLWVPIAPFLMLMLRQINGRDSSAKRESSKPKMTRFTDVAGVDSAKAELTEIVNCLKGDVRYNGLGAKLPSGVLLHGPPGTGKTLLARAVAGEAGVAFFATSASEFVEMFVGRGAARVRELFANARKKAPCIVFIDELDAVGGRRGASFSDERDQTLNQLLTEMDGFDSDSRVLVLAATNRIDSLDPAILRPGRISRRVKVGLPDIKGREDILGIHLRGKPLEGEVQRMISTVAALTEGLAGADLANIANEAALLAGRRGASTVTLEDLLEAVDRTRFGVGEREGPVKGWRRYLAKLVADSNGAQEPGNKSKLWQWKKLPENRSSPSVS